MNVMAADLTKVYKVAIYLRKSRDENGDIDDVLWKHRTRLVEYAESNGWRYDIYEEKVMSGGKFGR